MQGLIGDTHVLFSLQIIWIAAVNYLPPFYDRVRIADHRAHFVRNKGEGQCVEGTPQRGRGESLSSSSATPTCCPTSQLLCLQIILKCKFFIFLMNPSTRVNYEKKVAGI